jgi:hypothetical protein
MKGQMLAFFLIGTIVGGALMFLYEGLEINHLYASLEKTRLANQHLLEESSSLKKQIMEHQRNANRVHLVKVTVNTRDEFIRSTVTRFVKSMTASLIDRPVSALEDSPDLVIAMVENRELQINGILYTLHVRSVVLSRILWIQVDVKPVNTVLKRAKTAVFYSAAYHRELHPLQYRRRMDA